MSSSFDGWSAHEIIGPLNRSEVRAALRDHEISPSCFRTWNTIESMILSSSVGVKTLLYQTGLTKTKVEERHRLEVLKRRRESDMISRRVRRRLEREDQEDRDFAKFLAIPTAEEERSCYEAFYDATSKTALSLQICPICAREKLAKDGEQTWLLSDPTVVEVLTVNTDDRDKGADMMVLRDLLDVNEGGVVCWMCFECIRPLERHILPKLALANNLWIGDIPNVLTTLTIPEQLLIARHYPRCYIFKLFPRDCDVHIPVEQLHSAMAGNATLFEINTQEVVEMLNGQRMPSPVATLASVIAITFVGSKKLPMDWLKKTFRVRRYVVYEALIWLRENNPIYGDISIDSMRLEELPEDGVPEQLLAVVRQEEDDG